MGSLRNKPCYFCESPSTSKEHAPPRQLFKGFTCDSITVPSCDTHNSAKSSLDQAIVSAFLLPLHNGIETYSLDSDVRSAIAKARPAFERVKRRAFSASVINDPPTKEIPEVSYLDQDIRPWLRQLTAELIWTVRQQLDTTIEWDTVQAWSPQWVFRSLTNKFSVSEFLELQETQDKLKKHLEKLDWYNGWSASPRPYPKTLYYFQLHFTPQEVLFKHVFYQRYWWYVVICPNLETVKAMRLRVE